MDTQLQAGFMLKGKYEIKSKHDEGSLGDDIYLGRDHEIDRDVIIRILPQKMTSDSEIVQRFIQGVKLTASLNHPNIIPAFDAGEQDGIYYLITGTDKGYYLNEYLDQRGHLDEPESIRLIKSLADALNYAWTESRIIHRNIKPATILIARGNKPMLADFGFAKSLEDDQKLTMAGFAIGNPEYMSPEQINGADLDHRADMYCLGLIFYQLLAGHPPFQSINQVEAIAAQLNKDPEPLQDVNENVSDACVSVIKKMITKKRSDRYEEWQDLIDDLEAILKNKSPVSLQKGTKSSDRNKIIKEAKSEARKEYKKQVEVMMEQMAQAKKRTLKRNILIAAVIINMIILLLFVKYMMDKKKHVKSKFAGPDIENITE